MTFEPATSGGTVDYYRLDLFVVGVDPNSATPLATQNLGRPAVVSGLSSVDVGATILQWFGIEDTGSVGYVGRRLEFLLT